MGNGSFGHARFKSVKSTQILHLPFFFFTTTVFTSHSGKKTSFIAPTSFNLLTFCLTASTCSLADLLGFYFLGGNDGSTLSFFTTTVFTSHSGKKTSFIAPASFNLLTSCLTASTCSLVDLLGFYFLGGNDGSTLNL